MEVSSLKLNRNDRGSGSTRLGEILGRCRKQSKLSFKELAQESGLDETYLRKIEKGERGMSLTTFAKIAPVLGLDFIFSVLGHYKIRGME